MLKGFLFRLNNCELPNLQPVFINDIIYESGQSNRFF